MGMKFISGANLCFNLNRLRHLPSFYNPPDARGEDAFMSTTLADQKVVRVPCFTFHDAFLAYKHLLNGVLPTELVGVDAKDPLVLERFTRASIGWIRYKPLLTLISQPDQYETIIADMKRKLDSAIPKLCRYFDTRRFEQISIDLARYDRNVHRHHKAFIATRAAWSKVTQSLLSLCGMVSAGITASY